jgi:hypothetical protein
LEFCELDTQDYNMEELYLVVNAGQAYVALEGGDEGGDGVDNVKIERNSNT